MKLFGRKSHVPPYAYDPEKEDAVVRSSICTGEQVAGFKDRKTHEFHEVMLIRTQKDMDAFLKAYGLSDVKKEY